MRTLSFAALLAVCATALAIPPVPRKAPEFTIVEAPGQQKLLSSYKGKVVFIMFMSTTCPHCQRLAQEVSKLDKEFAGKGFQALGIAFNPEANPASVKEFIKQFNVSFPIGYSTPETVLSYLGVSVMERYVYPEVVLIDRKGMIRAQSPATGDANLQDPNYLTNMISGLLKEGAATSASAAKK
jgi:peroxiredoxin